MEVLSLLRGRNFQEMIIKEENNMPVTIDIKQDVRYNAGVEEGLLQTAERMIKAGYSLNEIQAITGLQLDTLIALSARIAKS